MVEFLHKLSPEILVFLCAGLILVVWFLIKNFIKRVMEVVCKIHQKLDYVIIEQQSTDHALNESLRDVCKNGYSKAKEEKRNELLKKYEFEHTLKVNL